jgi:hypothetical protein
MRGIPLRLSFVSIGQVMVDDYCTTCLHSGDIPGITKIPDKFVQGNDFCLVGAVRLRRFKEKVTA